MMNSRYWEGCTFDTSKGMGLIWRYHTGLLWGHTLELVGIESKN